MSLDTLSGRQRLLLLLDRYGALLTSHQREVMDLYYAQDWSLSEIAEHQSTSRAAVHDLVRRSTAVLDEYESKLGLVGEARKLRKTLDALSKDVAAISRKLESLGV